MQHEARSYNCSTRIVAFAASVTPEPKSLQSHAAWTVAFAASAFALAAAAAWRATSAACCAMRSSYTPSSSTYCFSGWLVTCAVLLYSVFIHLLLFWTAKSWWRDRGRRRDASTSTAINRLDHDLDYHDLLDHGRGNPRARPLPPQPRLRRHLGDHVFLVGRTSHVVHTDEKCRHLKNCTYTTLQTCKHCDQLVR